MSYLSVDGVHALLHLEKEDQKSDSTDEVILVLKEGKVATWNLSFARQSTNQNGQ